MFKLANATDTICSYTHIYIYTTQQVTKMTRYMQSDVSVTLIKCRMSCKFLGFMDVCMPWFLGYLITHVENGS